jgi:5-methylcytosine-specific restriction endonuclease McrA
LIKKNIFFSQCNKKKGKDEGIEGRKEKKFIEKWKKNGNV